jgi:hypothetical protein
LPIPFAGAHTFEGISLDPDHNGQGTIVSYAKHWFIVEVEEWQGLIGISNNQKITPP